MFEPLLIVLSGLMDRIRGDAFHFFDRAVDKFIYGWVLAAILGYAFAPLTLPIIIAFMLGMSTGWGDTMSAFLHKRELDPTVYTRKHWWQRGVLKTSKWKAATVRGLIWGLPVAALGFFDPILFWMPLVYVISYIGSLLFSAQFLKGSWEHAETLRGLMAGSLIALLVNYKSIWLFILTII